MIRLIFLALSAVYLLLPVHLSAQSSQQPPVPEAIQSLQALQKLDQRLHNVGYRLASANAEFCPTTISNLGLLIHDIDQYGNKSMARRAFGFDHPIAINAIALGSPAALAQLAVGDNIIDIAGQPIENIMVDQQKLADEKAEYRRIAAVKDHLAQSAASGEVALTLTRENQKYSEILKAARTCPSQFQIRVSKSREASADGKMVSVSSTLAEYVVDDNELAAIAAHELAHNILKHRDRLNALKVNRGFFGQFGKSAGRIKAAEIEADRLSVWLMANAGYDPQAAIRFWTRYGKRYGKGIFSASTHYRWKKRVKLFAEELKKMTNAKTRNGKFAPPLLTQEAKF
ncbi:MAG: M48 family metallopeptidase [Parasphingorhabdus sp.]